MKSASPAATPRLSKSAIYTQIQRTFLESKETSGKTILLMIDEAHLLQTGPLEELRLLTNFKMDSLPLPARYRMVKGLLSEMAESFTPTLAEDFASQARINNPAMAGGRQLFCNRSANDPLTCPKCFGKVKIISVIDDQDVTSQ